MFVDQTHTPKRLMLLKLQTWRHRETLSLHMSTFG